MAKRGDVLGVCIGEHGACRSNSEGGENERPVARAAVREREEQRRGEHHDLACEDDPLWIDDAGERTRECHRERSDPNGQPGSDEKIR